MNRRFVDRTYNCGDEPTAYAAEGAAVAGVIRLL